VCIIHSPTLQGRAEGRGESHKRWRPYLALLVAPVGKTSTRASCAACTMRSIRGRRQGWGTNNRVEGWVCEEVSATSDRLAAQVLCALVYECVCVCPCVRVRGCGCVCVRGRGNGGRSVVHDQTRQVARNSFRCGNGIGLRWGRIRLVLMSRVVLNG